MSNQKNFEKLKNSYAINYKQEEWKVRERLFLSCSLCVDLKFDIESVDVKELLYRLDVIFTQAKLDLAIVSKKLQSYNNLIDEEIKVRGLKARNNKAVTNETNAKAYAIQELKEEKDRKGRTVYEYRNIYAERYAFLSDITELIRMKKEMLITASAMLKLEASLIQ